MVVVVVVVVVVAVFDTTIFKAQGHSVTLTLKVFGRSGVMWS